MTPPPAEAAFKKESETLIKYFLTSLTIPENELWVNLSPFEKDRIIPQVLGTTTMGQDMLAQDYLLKQISASLIHPESELGESFWNRVYAEMAAKFGTIDLPVDTFNKIWIMPDKARLYEHARGAFLLETRLKVMLEEDYIALQAKLGNTQPGAMSRSPSEKETTQIQEQALREIVLPAIEREVNEGAHFAKLRQIYHSLLLATWYKNNHKKSLLSRAMADNNRTSGATASDQSAVQTIYHQYVQSFEKGVFNVVKEQYDPVSRDITPKKYFSGGVNWAQTSANVITVTDFSMQDFHTWGNLWKRMKKVLTAIKLSQKNKKKPSSTPLQALTEADITKAQELIRKENKRGTRKINGGKINGAHYFC